MCDCAEHPRCEWQCGYGRLTADGPVQGTCGAPAKWSQFQPTWDRPPRPRFRFVCDEHCEQYARACMTFMPGIDRPERADHDWRPSLTDHVRISIMKVAHEDRMKAERDMPDDWAPMNSRQEAYTPQQVRSLMALRAGLARG